MHIKFLARGTGSAAAAAAYLLAKRDAAGTERAGVEVLRGDPLEVARVADGLPFKYLYTSGVIAWSLEDAPSRAEIERVLDEFEETAWAGLDRDRYIWSAVLHRDHDGGVHVHIFAARCDLASGRSLNIAPPGWQKTFDPLRDAFNYQNGWSRPDDPARARPYRPSPHLAYLDAETLRAGVGGGAGPSGVDRGAPAGARDRRRGEGPRRGGGGARGSRLRSAPPGPALRDHPSAGDGREVEAEGGVVRGRLRPGTIHAATGTVWGPGTRRSKR